MGIINLGRIRRGVNMFIDSAKIYVKAGNGGNGKVSFHREKYVAAGGPDGGDGGKGGDVIFVATDDIRTLADFRYKRKYDAENGQDGGAGNCSGKGGQSLEIKLPVGTIIKDELTGRIMADLTKPGQVAVIAKGGKGGAGNQHFATPTRQVPNFAKSGDLGEEYTVIMELKLLADVGLIGFPNVGKSTILSMVTSAKPKIANYHFTTIDPNLGVVNLGESKSFVIADIPGLIEGAHEGIGLGHEFLKHIERTKLLVHVIDMASTEGRDPLEDFKIINEELSEYNPALAKRPQVIAANKMELPGADENLEIFKAEMEKLGYRVFAVSAATNKGLKELMYYLVDELDKLPDTIIATNNEEKVIYTAEEEKPFEIEVIDGVFSITGKWIRKLAYSTNFNDYESLQYFQRALKSWGVIDALEQNGINEDDTVRIYDIEFDYKK